VLFVALAFERGEAEAAVVGEVEERAGDAGDGWRLVEVSVEGTEDPVEFGDGEGEADAGVEGVFGDGSGEVGLAKAADEG